VISHNASVVSCDVNHFRSFVSVVHRQICMGYNLSASQDFKNHWFGISWSSFDNSHLHIWIDSLQTGIWFVLVVVMWSLQVWMV